MTATGVLDLDSPSDIKWQKADHVPRASDQLVLARLHGQPVAIVGLALKPGTASRADLMAAVWDEGKAEILSHIDRCRCLPVPAGPADLTQAIALAGRNCPCLEPPRAPGHAAVIVCTAGRGDELTRCLLSLGEMRCEDCEIVVVDNRPAYGDTKTLTQSIQSPIPIRYVPEPRPGLGAARNAGVAACADATFVAFTDDDVVVDERWLGWLLAPFEDPEVAGVTGLVMPLALESPAQKRFELYAGFGKGVVGDSFSLSQRHERNRFLYPYWGGMFGSGNSMAFRRDALLEIGQFDPALGAGTPTGGGEDIAAFTDILLSGNRLIYEPRSVCWHEHRTDEASLLAQVRNYGIGLTAVFWRDLWRDPGFVTAIVRSIPQTVRLGLSRRQDRELGRSDAELERLEMRGRLLGPWRYTISRRKARRG